MAVYVEDAHAHVQRLVSAVKMATVLQVSTTEELRSLVNFCGQEDSTQRIFLNMVKDMLQYSPCMYSVDQN
jgi:hypothetical protein